MTGSNTDTGRTTVNAGTLVVTSADGLGSSSDYTDVKGVATLKMDGAGFTLADILVLSGTGVGNGGALRNNCTAASGSNDVQTIQLNAATRIASDAGLLQLNGTITGTNTNLTLGGAGLISAFNTIQTGTGTLTKNGTVVVALYGDDVYTELRFRRSKRQRCQNVSCRLTPPKAGFFFGRRCRLSPCLDSMGHRAAATPCDFDAT